MKIEFPLKHIENNLLFNRNGDVWAYFETDIFNMHLLNYNNRDLHIYTSNKLGKHVYYVGFRLKKILADKSSFKVNIKSFFEGLNAQVSRSVGNEPYSIIEDDVKDYVIQSKEIELFLEKRMEVKPLETKDILLLYHDFLNLKNNDENSVGILNLDGANIESYDMNTLLLKHSTDELNSLYVQYVVVNSIESIEQATSLLDLKFPVGVSVRSGIDGGVSIAIRLEDKSMVELSKHIEGLYSYADILNINLFAPLGEQFIFLYENILGSSKTDLDYITKIKEREVTN